MHHITVTGRGDTQSKAMLAFLTEFTRFYELAMAESERSRFEWREFPRFFSIKPGEWLVNGRAALE